MVEKIIKLGLHQNLKSSGFGSVLVWGILGGLFVCLFGLTGFF